MTLDQFFGAVYHASILRSDRQSIALTAESAEAFQRAIAAEPGVLQPVPSVSFPMHLVCTFGGVEVYRHAGTVDVITLTFWSGRTQVHELAAFAAPYLGQARRAQGVAIGEGVG